MTDVPVAAACAATAVVLWSRLSPSSTRRPRGARSRRHGPREAVGTPRARGPRARNGGPARPRRASGAPGSSDRRRSRHRVRRLAGRAPRRRPRCALARGKRQLLARTRRGRAIRHDRRRRVDGGRRAPARDLRSRARARAGARGREPGLARSRRRRGSRLVDGGYRSPPATASTIRSTAAPWASSPGSCSWPPSSQHRSLRNAIRPRAASTSHCSRGSLRSRCVGDATPRRAAPARAGVAGVRAPHGGRAHERIGRAPPLPSRSPRSFPPSRSPPSRSRTSCPWTGSAATAGARCSTSARRVGATARRWRTSHTGRSRTSSISHARTSARGIASCRATGGSRYFFPGQVEVLYARRCGELAGARFFSFLSSGESLEFAQLQSQPTNSLSWVQCDRPAARARRRAGRDLRGVRRWRTPGPRAHGGGLPHRSHGRRAERRRVRERPRLRRRRASSFGALSRWASRALASNEPDATRFRVVVTGIPDDPAVQDEFRQETAERRPRRLVRAGDALCRGPAGDRARPAVISRARRDRPRSSPRVAASHEKRSRAASARPRRAGV